MFELNEKFILDESKAKFVLLEAGNEEAQPQATAQAQEVNTAEADSIITTVTKQLNSIKSALDHIQDLISKTDNVADDLANNYLAKVKAEQSNKGSRKKIMGAVFEIRKFFDNNVADNVKGKADIETLCRKWQDRDDAGDVTEASEKEFETDLNKILAVLKTLTIRDNTKKNLKTAKEYFDAIYNIISVNSKNGLSFRSPAVFENYKELLTELADTISEFSQGLLNNATIKSLLNANDANSIKVSSVLDKNITALANKINDLYKVCYPILVDIKTIQAQQARKKANKDSAKEFGKEDKGDIQYRAEKADAPAIDWTALFDRIAKSQGGQTALTAAEIAGINGKNKAILLNVPTNTLYDSNKAFDLYLKVEWPDPPYIKAFDKLSKFPAALTHVLMALGFNSATNPLLAFLKNTISTIDITSDGFRAIYEAYKKGNLKEADLKDPDILNAGNLIFCKLFYNLDQELAEQYLAVQKQALNSKASTNDERLQKLTEDVFIKTLFTGNLLDSTQVLTTWGNTLVPIQTVITTLQTLFPADANNFVKKEKAPLNVESLHIKNANDAALYIVLIANIITTEDKGFDVNALLERYDYNFDSVPPTTIKGLHIANKKLAETDINRTNCQALCDEIAETGNIKIIEK